VEGTCNERNDAGGREGEAEGERRVKYESEDLELLVWCGAMDGAVTLPLPRIRFVETNDLRAGVFLA